MVFKIITGKGYQRVVVLASLIVLQISAHMIYITEYQDDISLARFQKRGGG